MNMADGNAPGTVETDGSLAAERSTTEDATGDHTGGIIIGESESDTWEGNDAWEESNAVENPLTEPEVDTDGGQTIMAESETDTTPEPESSEQSPKPPEYYQQGMRAENTGSLFVSHHSDDKPTADQERESDESGQ